MSTTPAEGTRVITPSHLGRYLERKLAADRNLDDDIDILGRVLADGDCVDTHCIVLSLRYPFDIRAACGQFFFHCFKSAVEVIHPVDHGFALGGEPRENK